MQKASLFAAGVIIALAGLFTAYQADVLPITEYEDVKDEAWCRGYADGTALMLARMMGIVSTPEMQDQTNAACLKALADGAEMPEFMSGPLVVE
jgi:hypothetical protein